MAAGGQQLSFNSTLGATLKELNFTSKKTTKNNTKFVNQTDRCIWSYADGIRKSFIYQLAPRLES